MPHTLPGSAVAHPRCATLQEWYDRKGMPYMLGLLLHGLPGTGKTSTIKVRPPLEPKALTSVGWD